MGRQPHRPWRVKREKGATGTDWIPTSSTSTMPIDWGKRRCRSDKDLPDIESLTPL